VDRCDGQEVRLRSDFGGKGKRSEDQLSLVLVMVHWYIDIVLKRGKP
jgi:hypothetical protein